MKRISMKTFGQIVRRVMETLPEEFTPYLDNVVVDVLPEPTVDLLHSVGLSDAEIEAGQSVFGLFDPLPLPLEGLDEAEVAPHRLIIFKRPLEEAFPERRSLVIEIRKTVIHELAHHFGWTDEELEAFDAKPDPFGDTLGDDLLALLENLEARRKD
ncbi:MAG: metallopeptidase family protein [Gemmataceae bacterium]